MFLQRTLLAVAVATACGAAQAGMIEVGGMAAGADGMVSARPNVCTVNFNSGTSANSCGATYYEASSMAPASSSHFRTGNVANEYASPAGDTTTFFTVGSTDGSPVTIVLSKPANYFGFYAGSLDTFNMVQFFMGTTLVDQFDGAAINAVAFPSSATDGNQAQANYIDYFPSGFYDRIVYSSSGNAFETDNHAFGVTGVPEPGAISLLGLGALALVAGRRRRTKG